jgi:organic hydroperoxide reductase OsmC/OhrA
MSTLKDFRFKVEVLGGTERLVTAIAEGKPRLKVATPPEFAGGIPSRWSPEDMLVGAVATCYALTLTAVAERRAVPLREFTVVGAGHVTGRADGRFGFVVIELGVELVTEEGCEEAARKAAEKAERVCIVANALEVPVELELRIRTVPTVQPAVTA